MAELLKHHHARKRFGQNFLIDDFWIRKIADAVHPLEGQRIVEIGPGQASLTRLLIKDAHHIDCVEIDRDLASWLRKTFPPEELTVFEADALKFDWEQYSHGAKIRIVGNLPYNISSQLLFVLSGIADKVIDQHFMLQKEVVDRMVAKPGGKDYGRLSVALQRKYTMEKLFDVPPEAFNPAPKVISSVVRMVPIAHPMAVDEQVFNRVVAAAFSMRRKTIKNTLGRWITNDLLEQAGIDPASRAETISLDRYVGLSNIVSKRGIFIPIPGEKKA